jgi:adenylate kinase family enzyme
MPAADMTSEAARIRSADRVHIIGGPGTGKSTLALRLGQALGLPVYSLDPVAYEGLEFHHRPLADRAARAEEISSLPQWFTEGIFVGWTDPLLERADVIIWLDHLGWSNAAARIVARTIKGAVREATVRRGTERFFRIKDYARNARQLFAVLSESREYWLPHARARRYPVTRHELDQALSVHARKLVHVTRKTEAGLLTALVMAGNADAPLRERNRNSGPKGGPGTARAV